MITIAIAKGRLQDAALELLARAHIEIGADQVASRKLAIGDQSGRYQFIFVKPADVPVYVEHGIADCGVVGRDVLMESEADLLVPLDLQIAKCRMIVAGRDRQPFSNFGMLRVATKYPRLATSHFGGRGIPVEIIQLSGSVELAPLLGLADCIVDLMETGRTLAENGLTVIEEIAASSGRFVVNRASYQLKAEAIAELIRDLNEALSKGVSK
ncbi:MAG: ATP phosphoribosyltransferase [Pyrinomonadaceae bacterium]